MSLLEKIHIVEKLHKLILQQKTGTPKYLALELGISRANLYLLIDELNELKMSVEYSPKYKTFYYKQVEMIRTHSTIVEVMDSSNKQRKTKGVYFIFKSLV